jgi:hypothetical protein
MRRIFTLCCLTLCLGPAALAQSQDIPGPPGVTIEKYNWSRERDVGPPAFSAPLEDPRDVRANIRRERATGGAPTKPAAASTERRPRPDQVGTTAPPPARAYYAYRLTLKNHGPKAIRKVDWDYLFLSAESGQELGRHQFTSEEKIKPGKQKELTILTSEPPTQKVGADDLDKDKREALKGRVVIVRVLYEDGTVWQRN